MADPVPLVVGPGQGQQIDGPAGGPLVFKLRGEDTGGSLTVVENVIGPGLGPPLHVHANEDELIHVRSGQLRFRLGEELVDAPEGSLVFIPRGIAHCFKNSGTGQAELLILFTPSGMEGFFDAFAATAPTVGAPAAFRTAGADVGMTVVGPPLSAG